MDFNVLDTGAYNDWLDDVCHHVEEMMDCTTSVQFDGVILQFKPFGRMLWHMRFEDFWLEREYRSGANPKATAYGMAIIIRQEWCEVIARKDEFND